jgi:XTP/dITP diphosphohydrolase
MRIMKNINKPPILIASTNPGKLREFGDILGDLPVNLLLPLDIGLNLHVEETGTTYAENAILKAQAYCQASNLLTLADDSGLEVDPLNGAPGLHSARYSPEPGATDADRRKLLLRNLTESGLPRPWTARFHCTVALAAPEGKLELFEGEVEGEILTEERGSNGFGYDPLFFIPALGKTMAELPEEEKNRLSHRGRATEKARGSIARFAGLTES